MKRHPDLRSLLEFGADGSTIPPGDRSGMLEHVRTCPVCRARLAAADPSRLFALLSLGQPPSALLERLAQRVDAAIAGPEAARAPARRSYGPASLAASLLLAGFLGAYLWTGGVEAPLPAPAASAVQRVEAEAPVREKPPAAMIQVISSPGTAQVLDLSVGDTQLIMIFDEALDI